MRNPVTARMTMARALTQCQIRTGSSRMEECLALARERLCSWGAAPVARDVPLSEEDGLSPLPVAWEAYEDS